MSKDDTCTSVVAPKSTCTHSLPPSSMVAVVAAHQVSGQLPKSLYSLPAATQLWQSIAVLARHSP